ncbi:Thioesterase superfamily protein [Shimia sp. SK013]|uniref:PaaI family thioesterase n=1 Tax=Shimia sp. SK013 TaxID=1389006 RepID=UPI0006B4F00D|nr:PaaI family thioesterase [Shimia sp. SK013]KPA20142.1 Thioesterase superfamily protein [Shimia sp. SK013]
MTLPENLTTKLRHSFAKQSMMATFGAQLDEMPVGQVTLRAPILDGCQQQQGFAHAALTFGLGDSAAGYSALSVMPLEAEVLTSEMKIHLLAPAQGDRLEAIGKVIKPGRRLVIVQAEVFAISGDTRTQVALMTGTMVPELPK